MRACAVRLDLPSTRTLMTRAPPAPPPPPQGTLDAHGRINVHQLRPTAMRRLWESGEKSEGPGVRGHWKQRCWTEATHLLWPAFNETFIQVEYLPSYSFRGVDHSTLTLTIFLDERFQGIYSVLLKFPENAVILARIIAFRVRFREDSGIYSKYS